MLTNEQYEKVHLILTTAQSMGSSVRLVFPLGTTDLNISILEDGSVIEYTGKPGAALTGNDYFCSYATVDSYLKQISKFFDQDY